ncbi:MAG: hypothetical protein QMD09_11300, partial [Desulfatibacillaceae bacterium]|nr:hypothetical protein [Desulfatibacillaceae bacterium]
MQRESALILGAALCAAICAAAWFFIQATTGVNLADEGYLWYGVLRTVAGEMPLRDFQAYEPGRYYILAGLSVFFGQGLVGLRAGLALFAFAGILFALLAFARTRPPLFAFVLFGLVCAAWIYPRHKAVDWAVAAAAVYFATRLLERPGVRESLVAGVFTGIAGLIGANHLLYAFIAFPLVLVLLRAKGVTQELFRPLVWWFLGVNLGYLPGLYAFVFVPGAFDSVADAVAGLLAQGGTNLSLPVPWFWRPQIYGGGFVANAASATTGLVFLLAPLFYGAVLLKTLLLKKDFLLSNPLPVACACVGIVYLHHAFARADLEHLAQAIAPFLIGVAAAPAAFGPAYLRRKALFAAWALLVPATILCVAWAQPAALRLRADAPWQQVDIAGESLVLAPDDAALVRAARQMALLRQSKDEALLFAPFWPGLYAVTGVVSPLYTTYFLFPPAPRAEGEMIRTLKEKNLSLALVGGTALDGREERSFMGTHPLLWKYLDENFQAL